MAYGYEYPYVDPQKYNDDWLIHKVIELEKKWEAFYPKWEESIEDLNEMVAQIKKELDAILNVSPAFLEKIISEAIKNVWFGLTDDGYFCAYIPSSWDTVQFRTTGLDINIAVQPEYGHLVLQY